MNRQPWFNTNQAINCFLGYRSIYSELDIDERVLSAGLSDDVTGTRQELVACGVDTLTTTFQRIIDVHDDNGTTHVLPLSGGLDSRTILGGLLDNVGRDRIITITFGTPGTWDFEIGRMVAAAAGTQHFTVDLRPESFPWTEERLIRNACDYRRPTKLFRAYTSLDFAFEKLHKHHDVTNAIYWSGFLGDAVTGDHLPDEESMDWAEALEMFKSWNLKCLQLTAPNFDPDSVLPAQPAVDRDVLSFDDQFDFGIRQPYFIKPAAIFNDHFVAPFAEEPFLSFILNVPREHRKDRSLFEEIVAEAYPDLFSLPTATKAGLPLGTPESLHLARVIADRAETRIRRQIGLEQPSRSTSHLDWDLELRRSEPFQQFVKRQLRDLDGREQVSWLSASEIFREHQYRVDRGQEIMLLTSLELFLKAED